MNRFKAKQIKKYIAASIRVTSFSSTASSSAVVTSALTTACATGGYSGTAIAVTPSTVETAIGIITNGANNRVDIYKNSDKSKLSQGGNEIYGRITQASGVYTLSYFYLSAGVETAYTFSSNTVIDFEFNYRFEFKDLPTDALIGVDARNVQQDPTSGGGSLFTEVLTVGSLNIVSDLTKNPNVAINVELIVNTVVHNQLGGSPPFSVSGTAVTWNPVNAQYDLETTDLVIARYTTVE